MTIDSTKGRTEVETIEAAAAWLVEMQPSYASVDGVGIDSPAGGWTIEAATDSLAAAMAEGDWYWVSGSAYCPACVRCAAPAIDREDPLVTRGSAVSRCTCCQTDYAAL